MRKSEREAKEAFESHLVGLRMAAEALTIELAHSGGTTAEHFFTCRAEFRGLITELTRRFEEALVQSAIAVTEEALK